VTTWQPHGARAFLSGIRKKGEPLQRDTRRDGTICYKLMEAPRPPHIGTAGPAPAWAAGQTLRLSPSIIEHIHTGDIPRGLTHSRLLEADLPLDWDEQERARLLLSASSLASPQHHEIRRARI
tara:strand:+ start:24583 stop:24951 length:369 start_codon:yes stop_codon:yes gene_type:complete